VLKVLPMVKKEIYYLQEIEYCNRTLTDYLEPLGFVSNDHKYYYNKEKELGLDEYRVLRSIKFVEKKIVNEYNFPELIVNDYKIKVPRVISKPVEIMRPFIYICIKSLYYPDSTELKQQFIVLELSLII
jgi:hypothetical protein